MKKLLLSFAALAALAIPASAITITPGPLPFGTPLDLSTSSPFVTGGSWVNTSFPNVSAKPSLLGAVDFYRTTADNLPSGFYSAENVTMTFDLSSSLSLLWGSPDSYNRLEFFLGGVSQGAIVPGTVFAGQTGNIVATRGAAVYVTFSDVTFDSVVASSPTQAAFEFAGVVSSEVAVPEGGATLALLGSLMGGMVLVRRFKK